MNFVDIGTPSIKIGQRICSNNFIVNPPTADFSSSDLEHLLLLITTRSKLFFASYSRISFSVGPIANSREIFTFSILCSSIFFWNSIFICFFISNDALRNCFLTLFFSIFVDMKFIGYVGTFTTCKTVTAPSEIFAKLIPWERATSPASKPPWRTSIFL